MKSQGKAIKTPSKLVLILRLLDGQIKGGGETKTTGNSPSTANGPTHTGHTHSEKSGTERAAAAARLLAGRSTAVSTTHK